MEHHGFGRKTFTVETDEKGRAKIHFVKEGQIIHYDKSNDIWLAVTDSESISWSEQIIYAGHNQTFLYNSDHSHYLDNIWFDKIKGAFHGKLVYPYFNGSNWKVTAYQLREAFGLPYVEFAYEADALKHLFSRINNMMPWGKNIAKLSKCEAEWLDKSRFFNPNQPFFDKPPRIDLNVSPVDTIGSRHFQFEVADEDGMHQAQLFVSKRIKDRFMIMSKEFHEGCHILNGKKEAVVEFEIADIAVKEVRLQMIDMYGNIAWREFQIKDETPESPEKP